MTTTTGLASDQRYVHAGIWGPDSTLKVGGARSATLVLPLPSPFSAHIRPSKERGRRSKDIKTGFETLLDYKAKWTL